MTCHKPQAFAKGLPFDMLQSLVGGDLREVDLDLDEADLPLLREHEQFKDFDPLVETITLQKAIYGLKAVPQAFRFRLHQIPIEAGCKQSLHNAQLYFMWDAKMVKEHKDHSAFELRSVHARGRSEVDDLKFAAYKVAIKKETERFLHTSIWHERTAAGVFMHQHHYAAQLKEAQVSHLKHCEGEQVLSEAAKKAVQQSTWSDVLDNPNTSRCGLLCASITASRSGTYGAVSSRSQQS
eukprot:4572930-Amphidinium_carterae.3